MKDLMVLIEELVKKYDLNKTDEAFIKWYVKLSKQERENVMPVILECTMNSLSKFLKKNN